MTIEKLSDGFWLTKDGRYILNRDERGIWILSEINMDPDQDDEAFIVLGEYPCFGAAVGAIPDRE